MNGDRPERMSKLARAVKYCFDCIYHRERIKGADKKRLRRLTRKAWRVTDALDGET